MTGSLQVSELTIRKCSLKPSTAVHFLQGDCCGSGCLQKLLGPIFYLTGAEAQQTERTLVSDNWTSQAWWHLCTRPAAWRQEDDLSPRVTLRPACVSTIAVASKTKKENRRGQLYKEVKSENLAEYIKRSQWHCLVLCLICGLLLGFHVYMFLKLQ